MGQEDAVGEDLMHGGLGVLIDLADGLHGDLVDGTGEGEP